MVELLLIRLQTELGHALDRIGDSADESIRVSCLQNALDCLRCQYLLKQGHQRWQRGKERRDHRLAIWRVSVRRRRVCCACRSTCRARRRGRRGRRLELAEQLLQELK